MNKISGYKYRLQSAVTWTIFVGLLVLVSYITDHKFGGWEQVDTQLAMVAVLALLFAWTLRSAANKERQKAQALHAHSATRSI